MSLALAVGPAALQPLTFPRGAALNAATPVCWHRRRWAPAVGPPSALVRQQPTHRPAGLRAAAAQGPGPDGQLALVNESVSAQQLGSSIDSSTHDNAAATPGDLAGAKAASAIKPPLPAQPPSSSSSIPEGSSNREAQGASSGDQQQAAQKARRRRRRTPKPPAGAQAASAPGPSQQQQAAQQAQPQAQQQQEQQWQQASPFKQQRQRQQQRDPDDGPVVLAGKKYHNLLDVRFHMRILQRSLLGEAEEVEVPRGSEHFEAIQAVFRLHPQYGVKVVEPISSFYVVRNPFVAGGMGCEFQFEDARGLRDDFSLLKATRPPNKNNRRAQLLEACAHAVQPQVVAAAAEAAAGAQRSPSGALLCERCGLDFKVELTYDGWPLSKLVHAYRESECLAHPPQKFDRDPATKQATFREQPGPEAAWARGWVDYHRRNARYSLQCKCCQGVAADARRAERIDAEQGSVVAGWENE